MADQYDNPTNPDMQSYTAGPQTPGIGPVTNQEMDQFMDMMPSRQNQLEQRAYQSYMDALGRLRQQEAQGLAPSASGAAEAQNRLNQVRGDMNAARAQMPPAINLEDYFNQRNAGMGSMIGQPVGSGVSSLPGGMSGATSDIEAAVQSGQMSPADAASAATGLQNPFNQMPTPGGALGGFSAPNAASNQDVQRAMPLASFLKNLFNKGASQ